MTSLTSFGPYRVLESLSSTPQAVSFVASPTAGPAAGHLVSLRFVAPTLLEDARVRERFLEELRTVARLNHVNVLQIFDIGQWQETFYLVLEMVHGRSLAVVLEHAARQQAALAPELAGFITAEICAGLSYAHTRRDTRGQGLDIVHGDLRPREVLVAASGEVKVANFGLSRPWFRELSPAERQSDDRCDYLAPEVLRGEEPTPASDVFSAGALAYRMVTGRMIRGTPSEQGASRLERPIETARVLDPSIPEPLAEAIMRALSLDPARRHASAADFRTEILGWLRKHAPGFGRHRLKAWLEEIMGAELTPPSAQTQPKPIHRKDFAISDPRSLLSPSSQQGEDDRSGILPHLVFSSQGLQKRAGAAPPLPVRTAAARPLPSEAAQAGARKERPLPSQVTAPKPPPPPGKPSSIPIFGEDDDVATGPPPGPPPSLGGPPKPAPRIVRPPEPPPKAPTTPAAGDEDEIFVSRLPASTGTPLPPPEVVLTPDGQAHSALSLPEVSAEKTSPAKLASANTEPARPATSGAATTPSPSPAAAPQPAFDYATAVHDDESGIDDLPPQDGLRPARKNVGGIAFLAVVLIASGVVAADLLGGIPIFSHHLQPAGPTETSAFVRSRPPNALVTFNGETTSLRTPANLSGIPLDAPVRIGATLPGYELEEELEITFTRAGPTSALLVLIPKEHTLRIDSEPEGAVVLRDGEPVGTTPTRLGPLRADAREGIEVVLQVDGYFDERTRLVWEPDSPQSSHRIMLRPDPNWEPELEEEP